MGHLSLRKIKRPILTLSINTFEESIIKMKLKELSSLMSIRDYILSLREFGKHHRKYRFRNRNM